MTESLNPRGDLGVHLNASNTETLNHIKEHAIQTLQAGGEDKSSLKNTMIQARFGDDLMSKDFTNALHDHRKSGDWKNDVLEIPWNAKGRSPLIEDTADNLAIEWKLKNPYSVSNSNPMNYRNYTYTDITTADHRFHHDELSKGDTTGEKNLIASIRESLANYQESMGTPRSEYTFAALIRTMARATGRSLLALVYVIINIAPVVEIFLYILRFILDRTIDIRGTKDLRQRMIKYAIFFIQLFGIYICVVFIFGFIVLPLIYMTVSIIGKILLYD